VLYGIKGPAVLAGITIFEILNCCSYIPYKSFVSHYPLGRLLFLFQSFTMRSTLLFSGLIASVLATEPFLNEPDTGLETYLLGTNWTEGSQPLLKDMRGIPDFDFAARQKLDNQNYAFYRTASAGEWSYRNNLEVWSKVKFRARFLTDVTKVNETLKTTILGYNFSSPVFIAPAARAGYGDERGELNFVEASGKEDTLYMAALYASKSIEEIAAAKVNNTMNGPQVIFQQVSVPVALQM
jgi:L-lactate dehydrogenase (cytochrome)